MILSYPRARVAIALTAALLAAAGLGTIPATTQAASPQSKPELGFRIGRTHHADGAWVGRYRVGGQRDYRTQPGKSSAQSAYRPAHRVLRVPGASVAATQRVAWILSTYGSTSDRTTAAAVDVAVHALLSRGRWRVGTPYTHRRTNATGDGRFIRSYATTILRQSAHRRGPYRTTLTASRVPAGDQTTVTVRIQNNQSLGPVITAQQQGLAVDVTYNGTRTMTVYLNHHGVGRAYFRANAGKTPVTATVHAVPDVALFLRRPYNTKASQVAVAGHHRTLRLRGYGLGVSTQSLTITNTAASVLVGDPLQSTYSVTGLIGHETVGYTVFGPFTSAATSCTGSAPITAKATITSNGTHSVPQWDPARTGYYAWRVAAHGNSTTRPASACGSAYLTQKSTRTQQSRVDGVYSVKVGHAFGPEITVSGFDRPEAHTVATEVYGPFLHKENARCTSSRHFRTLLTSIGNNVRWKRTTVVNSDGKIGFYVFQTTLGASTFMRTSHSQCGIAIHVTT